MFALISGFHCVRAIVMGQLMCVTVNALQIVIVTYGQGFRSILVGKSDHRIMAMFQICNNYIDLLVHTRQC